MELHLILNLRIRGWLVGQERFPSGLTLTWQALIGPTQAILDHRCWLALGPSNSVCHCIIGLDVIIHHTTSRMQICLDLQTLRVW